MAIRGRMKIKDEEGSINNGGMKRDFSLLLGGNEGFKGGIVIIDGDLGHPTQIFLQTFYLHLQFKYFLVVLKMLKYTVLCLFVSKS